MSIDIEAPPRRRGHLRWVAIAAVVLVATVAAVLVRGLGSGSPEPPTLESQLADRVATLLEESTPAQHQDHGHHQVAEATTMVCAAKTLGFEPAGATTVAEVRVFYGNHLCAVIEEGRPWDFAVKLSGPLRVLLTEPAQVQVAEGGEGYPERVRALIPPPYQEQALKALIDDGDMRDLRRRFDSAAK